MAEQAMSVEDRIAGFLAADEAPEEEVQDESVQAEPSDEANEEIEDGLQEQEAQDDTEEEVEEYQISSLAELAEHEEIPIEDLYNLTIPVTLSDGTAKNISIGEWKDSYQASELVKAERNRLIEQREAFEQEAKQRQGQMESAFYQASKFIENAEKQLMGGMDAEKLRELRETDPAEYAAVNSDYADRLRWIESQKSELAKEYQQLQDNARQEQLARQSEILEKARGQLPKLIPEWKDESIAKKEIEQIRSFGMKSGFTEQEMNAVYDPRVVTILRKAALYDAQESAAPEVKKRVVSIGKKVLKSGKAKTKVERKSEQRQSDYQRFQKTGGDVKDAAAFIEKHLLGDF